MRTIDENFLVGGPQHFDAVSKLSKITLDNFWSGNRGRNLVDINQDTGIQFTQEQADKIVSICRDAVTRYSKECPTEKSSSTLVDFIKRYKKGSKILKNLLTKEKTEFTPHNIKKYSKNIMTRMDYFRGFEGENKNRNNSLNILGIKIKKYLWDCKI